MKRVAKTFNQAQYDTVSYQFYRLKKLWCLLWLLMARESGLAKLVDKLDDWLVKRRSW